MYSGALDTNQYSESQRSETNQALLEFDATKGAFLSQFKFTKYVEIKIFFNEKYVTYTHFGSGDPQSAQTLFPVLSKKLCNRACVPVQRATKFKKDASELGVRMFKAPEFLNLEMALLSNAPNYTNEQYNTDVFQKKKKVDVEA